ncbi:conserved hypothetical protein [Sporisorium reilianum SRZ2]|uniref:Mak10-domain-containing protein n=1 Tax=Sporisorium reilianum (strain SRZ2) TaxID=999809 RepID=E6ZSL7_SPORE|nr:conserved hypothetical protein [Sporisorium reilianum SRZ2]
MTSICKEPTLSQVGAQDEAAPSHATQAVPPQPDFQDATALLFSACADLRHGQMVAVPNFTLMDSMAAVKIMDARMDSGMELPASELPESDRLEETLALPATSQFDPFEPLTVPDVLWIMDRLLACEAAWHQGSALSQTLYTCLYFHAIKSLSHKHPRFQRGSAPSDASSIASPETDASIQTATEKDQQPLELVYKVLRAFILATVKTIDIAWTELTSKQHLHDGEDFASDKNGLSLLETTDTGYVIAELEDALEWVNSQHDTLTSDHVESLKARLSFRKQMLYAVRLLQSPAEAAPLDVVMHTKFARRSWTLLQPASDAHPVPDTTISQDGASPSTANGSKAPPTLTPLQQPNRNAAPSIASLAAFDPAYNRRLAWCQALKPISLPNASATWRILDGILQELQDVVRVLQQPGFLTWKTFFTYRAIRYQTSQPLSATPYVRSLFQTAVCDRNMIASRLPLDWITETFFQEVAQVDPLLLRRASRFDRNKVEGGSQTMWNAPPPLGQRISYFMQRVAGQLVQYLTTLSHNRSRCKRTLASRLYREWVHISQEAQDLSRELEACLSPDAERYLPDSLFAATQHLALEIMTQITLSGFELDLYVGATDRESMWWLASRIQVEQTIVCTDLRNEVSEWLKQAPLDWRPRRNSATIVYLSRQILLAQATEQLAISSIFLKQLSARLAKVEEQPCPWPLNSEDESSRLELAGAVFASRIKWMRTDGPRSSRSSDAEDPGETLWKEYLAFRSELKATDDTTLTTLAKERLDAATKHLQRLTDSLEGNQAHELGAEGFSELVRSLLATARHNQEALRSVAERTAAAASPVDDSASSTEADSKAQTEQSFEHPWFPK